MEPNLVTGGTMSPASKSQAHLQYSFEGKMPVVELIVPHGTRLLDLLKIQDVISRELLPKIAPTGCGPCMSGADFRIREELEHVIPVDLAAGKLMGEIKGR